MAHNRYVIIALSNSLSKAYRVVLVATIIISLGSCSEQTSSDLIEKFRVDNTENIPNISVHRGGKGLINYPENCLETIKYVSDSIYGIYEIDVAQTKDNKLVLMHDNSIDRTTNGAGLVSKMTYEELQSFNLIDDFGNLTPYKVPLFVDVLKWCRTNNIILTIDIKRGVSQAVIVDAIRQVEAEDISILITYDLDQALSAHTLAPDLLLSVSARNETELKRLLGSKIPTRNLLAFTGTRLSEPSLYKELHNKDIVCILGTLGNLDQRAEARGDHLYKNWRAMGVDIFATDRPFEVAQSINN